MRGATAASLLIIAGETSGDQLGAGLVRELHRCQPHLQFYGIGGVEMRSAGVDIQFDLDRLNAMGLAEVVTKIPYGLYMAGCLLAAAQRRKTRVVILIDAPGFNLTFAYLAKKCGLRVVYYVSPQIWAWRRGRIKKIARRVDRMLTLFPFEVPLYTAAGVTAAYVGHPLVDRLADLAAAADVVDELELPPARPLVAILPGSRRHEMRRLLAPMLDALAIMQRQYPSLQAVLPLVPSIDPQEITPLVAQSTVPVRIVLGQSHKVLRAAQVALVASGTATLEAGLIGTPMVVVYKAHAVTAFVARLLIQVPHIGLVNIVAGKQIVPELLQHEAEPHLMAEQALVYLNDVETRRQVTREFSRLRELLGPVGGAQRAAAQVVQCLAEVASQAASELPTTGPPVTGI